jgi:hypothetical protein
MKLIDKPLDIYTEVAKGLGITRHEAKTKIYCLFYTPHTESPFNDSDSKEVIIQKLTDRLRGAKDDH